MANCIFGCVQVDCKQQHLKAREKNMRLTRCVCVNYNEHFSMVCMCVHLFDIKDCEFNIQDEMRVCMYMFFVSFF